MVQYSEAMTENVLFLQTSPLQPSREKVAGAMRYAESTPWYVNLIEVNSTHGEVRRVLRHWNPVGCIVERGLSAARVPKRLFAGTPVVYIDQMPHKGPEREWCVCHDSRASVRRAFAELEAGKPAGFAFVRDARRMAWSHEREMEFTRLAARYSCEVLEDSLSLSEALVGLPKPCGLLAATDAVARRVVDAAHLADIAMPDDLRIVGINNDVFVCEHSNPTITSVYPDFEGCGYLAMATLHRIVRGTTARPQTLFFGPKELVRRASTRLLLKRDARVTRALGYVEQHYAEPEIDAMRVAGVMGCSRSLADLRFREATGRTIREEIQERRLESAKRLLADPNRVLAAIPSLCGCLSQTTFMRFFKSRTGKTMSEFRREILGGK